MATPYEKIFDVFYKKLVNDNNFFKYGSLSESEIQQLVEDHSISLLKQSINYFYTFGNPEINMNDFDDVLGQINADLNYLEIDIVTDGMKYMYSLEDYNKIKSLGLIFSNKELNVFSPSAERTSIMNLVNSLKDDLDYRIQSYLNRSRVSNKMKANNFA